MTSTAPAGPADPAPDEAATGTDAQPRRHIVAELGMQTSGEGTTRRGQAEVRPEVCLPGTSLLRTSVLATWADVLAGAVAAQARFPRISVTLELEVQVRRTPRVGDRVEAVATAVKIGQTVTVCETRFFDGRTGELAALSYASFVVSPNPAHVFPAGFPKLSSASTVLTEPLADRVGRTVTKPGEIEMPRRLDGLNSSGAIQGGLVAFAAEEAVLSLLDKPAELLSLNVRYLRPIATGPARATAHLHGGFADVEITDAGTGKLTTLVTARLPTLD
ncbi:hotdog domain-containing protein [Parafrankia sp. EUN1f]|uniref:PaaI family thioesterase n=1 Tax=Parafrankia sp. EUN1f TaxID=102897 RepID=UPI0001C466EA|nr:hotdog domain-containing protein [Parafrankia sp. EUN1f]EFC86405.1 thioesterase superfamily protein [Parafrankia sp. EUN1f]